MRAEPGDGNEGISGAHGAAVQHQAGQNGVMAHQGHVRKQLRKQHRRTHCVPPVAGGVWACALGSAASNSAAASTGSAASAGGAGRIEAEWPTLPDCWAASHDCRSSSGTSIRRSVPSITL
ncbi:hypothetical protein G6F65_022361 [Rhizopus arrhizus]|nr:hypothetical protein G6F65_022361 [Rhizopus arrhizus]